MKQGDQLKKFANGSNPSGRLLSSVLTAMLFVVPGSSGAATIQAKYKQNAAGACQGALPAFAGTLRARPLGLQNEGGTPAFVTCSLPYDDDNGEGPTTTFINALGIRLINSGSTEISVTCTLVDGDVFNGAPTYIAKAATVPPEGVSAMIWNQFEYPEPQPALIARPNISCALPAGVGIGYVYYYYNRQVGS